MEEACLLWLTAGPSIEFSTRQYPSKSVVPRVRYRIVKKASEMKAAYAETLKVTPTFLRLLEALDEG